MALRPLFAGGMYTFEVSAVFLCAAAVCEDIDVVYKTRSAYTESYIFVNI